MLLDENYENKEGELQQSGTSLDNNPTPTLEEQSDGNAPLFTQEQVNEIAGRTRKEASDRAISHLLQKYELNSLDDFDNVCCDAQRYAILKDDYDSLDALCKQKAEELKSLQERIALLESGISRERFEDASFILKGKGKDITIENIEGELATHPEWKQKAEPASGAVGGAENPPLPFQKISTSVRVQDPQRQDGQDGQNTQKPQNDYPASVLGNDPNGGYRNDAESEKEYVMKKLWRV